MRESTDLKRLETRITELEQLLKARETDLARVSSDAKYARTKIDHYRNRNMMLAAAHEAAVGAVSKIASESMMKKEAGTLALMLERWQADDRAELCYRALYKTRGEEGERLTDHLSDLEGGFLDEVRRQHYHERDVQIAEYLSTEAFDPSVADTLRVAAGISWNVVRWIRDTWKWDWRAKDADGAPKKARRMLAPDSNVPLPEPFCIKMMRQIEDQAVSGTGGNVGHDDGKGAEVRDVDATLLRAFTGCDATTMGGMATAGTKDDPHWATVTLDCAGLTHDESGVRLALVCASVERMNQSAHGVHTIAFWQASSNAEHWSTVLARTKHVRPALCRLFRDGELLLPDGSGSGVFVKLLLTADKPALCHMLGRRSFAHDFFSPFCPCSERNGDLNNFTHDPLTHYDALTFQERCALALVAEWEALGEPEPTAWTIKRKDKVKIPLKYNCLFEL